MDNVEPLKPYEVYEFSWGSAVKHAKGDWECVFLRPDACKIDIRGLDVEISDAGIMIRGSKNG